VTGYRRQGYFGSEGRQTVQLEKDTRGATEQAANRYRLSTSRVVEIGDRIQVTPGSAYRVDAASPSGKGAIFILPDPAEHQGMQINIAAFKDTAAGTGTTFTIVPAGGTKAAGSGAEKTYRGRLMSVVLTSNGDDWVQSSVSSEAP